MTDLVQPTMMTGTVVVKTQIDLDNINHRLDGADATQVLRWAVQQFGRHLVMSSSFGAQAAVMLHLATRVVPDIPVILIDTGYLFPETYRFVDQLTHQLKLNLKVYQPAMSPARHEALFGRLWEQGEEGLTRYHQARKIEPMRRALQELGAQAWLAGLRHQQTEHRARLRAVEQQDGVYKIHPILTWTTQDVHRYLKQHDLPYHPLYEQGYLSIGDTHSTTALTPGMDERASRFGGLKQECGLHLPTSPEESDSRESSSL